MDRRNFLLSSGLVALSVSTFGHAFLSGSKMVGDCKTTNDILGPFYRPDAPFRQDLENAKEGIPIQVKGKVYGSDCTTPLKDAVVEIWHADHHGRYDNTSDAYLNRAQWKVNAEGDYTFSTILPGRYKNGEKFRPSHIHYRVTGPGHRELISQIYFENDPYIKSDPWASKSKAKQRVLPIHKDDQGNQIIQFDVYLGA